MRGTPTTGNPWTWRRGFAAAYLVAAPALLGSHWGEFTSLPTWLWVWLLFVVAGDWLKTSVYAASGDERWL